MDGVIYLDTSALAKLVVEEQESAQLAAWLDDHADWPLCTSLIGRVELLRAAGRVGAPAVARAHGVLAECALVPLDAVTVDIAGHLEPAGLRTLDAVHLASALSLGADVRAFVSYDIRQAEAATELGLPVQVP